MWDIKGGVSGNTGKIEDEEVEVIGRLGEGSLGENRTGVDCFELGYKD